MEKFIPAASAEARRLAKLDAGERAAYDAALAEARARIEIAQMVYDARHTAGFTQVQLADAAGTNQKVISSIETGTKVPGGVTLAKIAHALGGSLKIDIRAA